SWARMGREGKRGPEWAAWARMGREGKRGPEWASTRSEAKRGPKRGPRIRWPGGRRGQASPRGRECQISPAGGVSVNLANPGRGGEDCGAIRCFAEVTRPSVVSIRIRL